ncbi:carboxylesterase family protein, partial [Nafulsella turpanensis]|uniref:carboxylesterase family protein n=1 Tax=Nafulsella turpanensis TaxID=1265690 RepID=UPI000684E863
MKNLYITIFLLLGAFSLSQIQAQTITPVAYYPMLSWDTSPYKSFRYTRAGGSWDWMNFRLLYPQGYDSLANDGKKYPIIIMLHGAGESARMEWSTKEPYPSGDPRIDNNDHQLLYGGREHLKAVTTGRFPGFVLFPQNFYGTWINGKGEATSTYREDLKKAVEIIELLVTKLKVDPDRIYVHGLSNGGAGSWYAAFKRPDLFAAALPMSAPGDPAMAQQLKSVPLWVFQGELDTNPRPAATLETVNAVREAGGSVRYTEYTNVRHNTWNKAYTEPDFFEWMLSHTKNTSTTNNPPIVNAGLDKSIKLPQDTTSFIASASDKDGSIASFLWAQLSGPTVTLSGSKTATLKLSGLKEGSYSFRVTVTDNKGATASDEVSLSVQAGSTQQHAPVLATIGKQSVKEGQLKELLLTASDADGDIVSFLLEGTVPSFVSLTDHRNNTATLQIKPASGTAGAYAVTVVAKDNSLQDKELVNIDVTAPESNNELCQSLVLNGSTAASLSKNLVLSGDF